MKYLITGVLGAGKSTINQALKDRGYTAYDSDEVKNLGRWENKNGQPVKGESRLPKDWNWNEDKLVELLDQPGDVFFCGLSSNQYKFYAHFDKIFLLQIGQKAMEHRLHTRKKNSFGRDPEALKSILSWHKSFEDDLVEKGAITIDAALSIDKIIDKIHSDK